MFRWSLSLQQYKIGMEVVASKSGDWPEARRGYNVFAKLQVWVLYGGVNIEGEVLNDIWTLNGNSILLKNANKV